MSLSWARWAAALVVSVAGGCRFDRPADVGPPIDAAPIDAMQVCTPNTQTCTAGRYTACDAEGQYVSYAIPNGGADGSATTLTMHDYECPMGCAASLPRCADPAAGNGFDAAFDDPAVSDQGLDLALPHLPGLTPGVASVDTGLYDAVAHEITITDVDGAAVRVPARVIAQVDAPEILVLEVRTLVLREGTTLMVSGDRALGVAAHFDIVLSGVIDLDSGVGRRGSMVGGACEGRVPAGGFSSGGGGNAGFGGFGSGGGASGDPSAAEPLTGGCGGGLGFPEGGGAAMLASRTRVALAATAVVDMTGNGGHAAAGLAGGGGAGGTLQLWAPTVTIADDAQIHGRGGSGAAASPVVGMFGNAGTTTGSAPAAGVTCGGCGTSGTGGTEVDQAGNGSGSGAAAGGGGGSVGMCWVRNRSGTFNAPTGLQVAVRAMALLVR